LPLLEVGAHQFVGAVAVERNLHIVPPELPVDEPDGAGKTYIDVVIVIHDAIEVDERVGIVNPDKDRIDASPAGGLFRHRPFVVGLARKGRYKGMPPRRAVAWAEPGSFMRRHLAQDRG